jgi:hypothetical protein
MRHQRQVHVVIAAVVAGAAACGGSSDEPNESDPALLTRDLPFVYPPALYAARVEGDVGLRLFVDSLGLVIPESTSVAEPPNSIRPPWLARRTSSSSRRELVVHASGKPSSCP